MMIRNLKEEDIPQILDLYNWYIVNGEQSFETEPVSLEIFTERTHGIAKDFPYIVLEEDGKVVGYAYLSKFAQRYAYRFSCDLSIYVDHTRSHKGYGSILMKEILKIAKDCHYHSVFSVITSSNQASIHIHEKFGFIKRGTMVESGYKHGKWLSVDYYQLCFPVTDPPLEPKKV